MKMWMAALCLAFMAAAMPSSLLATNPEFETGARLWDFRDTNRVAVPETTMIDGAMLPDGSMAVLAMGDEWRGSLGLYRLAPNGDFRSRQEFEGWIWWNDEQPNPAIVPIVGESVGFIVVGSHMGYARLPLEVPPLQTVAWVEAPFVMATSVSASLNGSVWIGGTENERSHSGPRCSRAVIARYGGNDKWRWQWVFEDQAEAMFVRRIIPLADGAILAHVSSNSPVGYGGGSIRLPCDEKMGHDWLVWVSADGRTLREVGLGHDSIEAMAVLSDGTIALADFTREVSRTRDLRLRLLSADGARTLIVRRYPASHERGDNRRVDATGWPRGWTVSTVENLRLLPDGFALAVSIDHEDGRRGPIHLLRLDQNMDPLALSAAWPGETSFLMGIAVDSDEYVVGGSAGVYRLKLP